MFTKHKGGSTRSVGYDEEWVELNLPPEGKVFNKLTGKVERRRVLFLEKSTTNRRWSRTPLPKEWKTWRKEEKIRQRSDPDYEHPEIVKFSVQEWDRRINGVWIAVYNPKTKKTDKYFLTGMHYFHLNWMRFQGFPGKGYPDFREVDLDVFQMLEWTINNPKCNGLLLATLRRFGKTAILGTFILDYISRTANTNGGLQSMTREDAKKVFNTNIFYPFKSLPDFFKPKYDYKTQSMLKFSEPANTSKSALDYDPEEDDSLYSEIDYRDSGEFAYDGHKLHRVGYEEPGKTKDVDVNERHNVVRPTTMVGPEIIGKIFAPTTIEELDNGGGNYLKLWNRSNYSDIFKEENKNGKTDSGLVNMFIPAYKGYMFDDYGRSLEQESKEELMNERANIKDKRDLAAFIRKFPFTFAEASMLADDQCVFNAYILTTRYNQIDKMVKKPYGAFSLKWYDKKDGPVQMIKDPDKGLFNFSWVPEPTQSIEDGVARILNNVGEKTIYVDGDPKKLYFPLNDHLFTVGTDPISYTKTADPRASRASAYAFRKFDSTADTGRKRENWESHNFFVEYIYRPTDPNEYFEQMIMLCRLLGCSILPEAQKTDIIKHFDDRGYGRFIMYRGDFKDEKIRGKGPSGDTAGVPATKEVIDAYTSRKVEYYERHGHRCPFDRLIEQDLKFNPLKTKEFDASVASGWTLLALDKITAPPEKSETKASQWFDEYGPQSQS